MANIFEFLSKDGNITPEKARKSRQMPFHDKTAYVWMGMLPLKKRVNRDKCSFATKQRMLGVIAYDEPRSLTRALCATLNLRQRERQSAPQQQQALRVGAGCPVFSEVDCSSF